MRRILDTFLQMVAYLGYKCNGTLQRPLEVCRHQWRMKQAAADPLLFRSINMEKSQNILKHVMTAKSGSPDLPKPLSRQLVYGHTLTGAILLTSCTYDTVC